VCTASTLTRSAVHLAADEIVDVLCTVTYYGNSKPNIQCTPGSDSTVHTSVNDVIYRMKIVAWNADDSLLIECTLRFSNVPSFINNTWTTSVLRRGTSLLVLSEHLRSDTAMKENTD